MNVLRLNRKPYSALLVGAIFLSSFSAIGSTATFAQAAPPPIWQVRAMEADQTGINQPVGLTFSSRLNAFYAMDARNWTPASPATDFIEVTPTEAHTRSARIAAAVQDPINVAYDNQANRLLILQAKVNQLLEVPGATNGQLDAKAPLHHNISGYGLQDPQGLTIDPTSGDLFILDAAGPRVVRTSGGLDNGTVSVLDLASSGMVTPHGIAFDPSTGYLQVLSPTQQKLYELNQSGEVTAVRDLSQFNLKDVQGMVFAPSGDQTDDPAQMSLYLADTGSSTTTQQTSSVLQNTGQIVELSLLAPATLPPGTTLLPSTLVSIFNTSTWSNPSPDPSGIDYWPATGQLVISDSEIEEPIGKNPPAYWHGYNVFLSSLAGSLQSNCTTFTSNPFDLAYNNFSDEPAGLAINPNNNHIFFSNDGASSKVYELSPGTDGVYCNSDDIPTRTLVTALYGASDAEDVAYGNNTLFISDGTNAEVYRIPLGADGVLGGGDDGTVTHFDTASLGFHDLEGIGYNADSGTLFIVSTVGIENYLGEVTTSGTLVNAYDLSFMGTQNNIRSDVVYAPSSQNPAVKSIYIASRGIDNNSDPNENDGKVWEINIAAPDTTPPTVVSILRADANNTAASSVHFTVTFSESVTGVDSSDFTLTTTGVSGAAVSGVSGSGDTYTVTANTGSGNGTIRLDVTDNDSIVDDAGNPLGGSGAGNGNFNTGEAYNIIKTATFSDVPTSYWAWNAIEKLYAAGITGGCGNGKYCPEGEVTRAQMAVFLERGMNGSSFTPPPATGAVFTDVPASYWAAAWIEQLASDGITGGCGNHIYCPDNTVTRAQMAIFLLRAEHGSSYTPPAPTGMFGDVPTSYWAAAWIERLASEGITGGCGNGNYCPESPVTRAQMAVFLVQTFHLP